MYRWEGPHLAVEGRQKVNTVTASDIPKSPRDKHVIELARAVCMCGDWGYQPPARFTVLDPPPHPYAAVYEGLIMARLFTAHVIQARMDTLKAGTEESTLQTLAAWSVRG